MTEMIIYRAGADIATVSIDEKTVLNKRLMNEDRVSSSFISNAVLPFELGDYILINSKKYYLNQLPSIQKQNNKTFKYGAVFQGELYNLHHKLLISIDGLNEFSFVGNAEDLLTLIVNNMNEIDSGWAVGAVDSSDKKLVDFINDSCRTALTKISEFFKYEFELVGKTINLKKAIGSVAGLSFEYGKNKGLYSIERRQVDSKSIFTRVYGFGGSQNIPFSYRDRQKKLVFEERKLDKNISVFGIREGHYTNEDIYPRRTGAISDVNVVFDAGAYDSNESYVTDSSLDFNVNDYLLEGIKAKIVFKSGDLSGNEFEVWKYDESTKRIYFNSYTDGTDAYIFPNEILKPKAGDTYTLVNIEMPHNYVVLAEEELKAATQVFLDENAVPKSLYLVKIDSKFSKSNSISLDAGDLVQIIDSQLGIDRAIRISEVSYPLANPYKITATIADFIPYTLQELVTKSTILSSKQLKQVVNKITYIQNTSNITEVGAKSVSYNYDIAEPNTVLIGGRKFYYIKGYDNTVNLSVFEPGDFIYGNFFDRFTEVKKWLYLGGILEQLTSWEQIETIDYTTEI